MPNVIEVLRDLLVDDGRRSAFGFDPAGYLEGCGLGDLAGEDVEEALPLVCDRLPDDLAAPLRAALDRAPPVSPGPEETEMQAAVRQIEFAIGAAATSAVHDA